MKKIYLPYYLSRAAISTALGIIVLGFTWKSTVFAVVLFGFFLLYLHSGWFRVDPSQPLTPLRRDDRGREIQRKALIAAVVAGLLIYLILTQVPGISGSMQVSGSLALGIAVVTYFASQFALFARG